MNQSSSRVFDFHRAVAESNTVPAWRWARSIAGLHAKIRRARMVQARRFLAQLVLASSAWLSSASMSTLWSQPPKEPTTPPPSSEFQVDRNRTTPATKEQIQSWVDSLKDPRYANREWAAYQLWQHRNEALPGIVHGIEQAEGDHLDRLASLLGNMADDAEPTLANQSFAELKRLSTGMGGTKSIVCRRIYDSIRFDMAARNWDRISRLCKDQKRTFTSLSSRITLSTPLYINDSFQGTAADLNDLDLIDWVEFVRLEGPKINREILQAVLKLPNLTHLQIAEANLSADDLKLLIDGPDLNTLEVVYVPLGDGILPFLSQLPVWGTVALFGTDLTQKGADDAIKILADVDVIISRGAFLGVTCNQGAVMIENVEPGSAAEIAGLRVRDRLLRLNDAPLEKFEDLRKQLARHAPGEEVTIEFERRTEVRGIEPNESEPFDPNFFPLRRYELKKMQLKVVLGRRR